MTSLLQKLCVSALAATLCYACSSQRTLLQAESGDVEIVIVEKEKSWFRGSSVLVSVRRGNDWLVRDQLVFEGDVAGDFDELHFPGHAWLTDEVLRFGRSRESNDTTGRVHLANTSGKDLPLVYVRANESFFLVLDLQAGETETLRFAWQSNYNWIATGTVVSGEAVSGGEGFEGADASRSYRVTLQSDDVRIVPAESEQSD